jgi:hypothetical protein
LNIFQNIDNLKVVKEWYYRQQMIYIYEVATKYILGLLPSAVKPFEIRPSISIISIGYNEFHEENLIYGHKVNTFYEFTIAIAVVPNLVIDVPTPRFCFYVPRVGSNNEMFLRHEKENLFLPTYYSPTLEVEYSDNNTSILVRDKDGLIQECVNTNPNLFFETDAFFAQYFTLLNDKLYCGLLYQTASHVATHQKNGDGGRIYDHPFFAVLGENFSTSFVSEPYMQMITRFNTLSTQKFFEPILIE